MYILRKKQNKNNCPFTLISVLQIGFSRKIYNVYNIINNNNHCLYQPYIYIYIMILRYVKNQYTMQKITNCDT